MIQSTPFISITLTTRFGSCASTINTKQLSPLESCHAHGSHHQEQGWLYRRIHHKTLGDIHQEHKQWTRCNLLIKGWILNTISPNIAQSVMYNDNASKIWLELKEQFSHMNNVHLFQVNQEIHECIQGNMSIGDYYTKLKGL